MNIEKLVSALSSVVLMVCIMAGTSRAADLTIALQLAQAGEGKKYLPLLEYLGKKGISATFQTVPDYGAAATMFATGKVDAMFSGSGVAGTMIIKGLAYPVVRPVNLDGTSTYAAVIVAPKNSPKYSGKADYFNGKKVIFAPLASAGEIYFRSLGLSKPSLIIMAANHGAALESLARGDADVAIVKNHVWNKEKGKYPQLEMIHEDKGQNPDGTLIVSKKMNPAMVQRVSGVLLAIKDDSSHEAVAAQESLKISEFIRTTEDDFKYTLAILKKAGVTPEWEFKF
ncbi:MAG TPA: PhnD/SsuA/transferrin family substrate-binding protein [Nitrospirota bacterium]|nr:PhnD/SsuA/transferrin family substrate-binding protein [Nitrospirota bacterium]